MEILSVPPSPQPYNAFQKNLAEGTYKVGDTYFLPNLVKGLPGVTTFMCISENPAKFDVFFDGVKLCTLDTETLKGTPTLKKA